MQTKISPHVVLLAAGRGSRSGKHSLIRHKALQSIGYQSVISLILEKFPIHFPVVVAIGHLGTQLKDYLNLAHPERIFKFVEVKDWDLEGSGPGSSLLQCKAHIPGPFYFSTIDTLVKEPLKDLSNNWIGVSTVENKSPYCTVLVRGENKVQCFFDKDPRAPSSLAFIGLCGIKDSDLFWEGLNSHQRIDGEHQVSCGLEALIEKGLFAQHFSWQDTGTPEGLQKARLVYCPGTFDFSKTDEAVYLTKNHVVKWFTNSNNAKRRANRANRLAPYAPTPVTHVNQFFSYPKAPGVPLYESLDTLSLHQLWSWLEKALWETRPLEFDKTQFREACDDFYRKKTLARFKKLCTKLPSLDNNREILNIPCPSVSTLLSKINWDHFHSYAIASEFHGDLQFDNILYTPSATEPFTLIDWRQDFGGLNYGDRYYDLAKLYGGLYLNYNEIRKGRQIELEERGGHVRFLPIDSLPLKSLRQTFSHFCKMRHYDREHIELITALIYLNMAPLHVEPFDKYLYYFSQYRLTQLKNEKHPSFQT